MTWLRSRFYWHNQWGWTRLGPIGWARHGRAITIGVGRWGKTWVRGGDLMAQAESAGRLAGMSTPRVAYTAAYDGTREGFIVVETTTKIVALTNTQEAADRLILAFQAGVDQLTRAGDGGS